MCVWGELGSKKLRADGEGRPGEVWVGRKHREKVAAISGQGRSPLQAQHLLSLVLIVIHLSAVRQPLIPRLWKGAEMLNTGAHRIRARLVGEEPRTEIRGVAGEAGALVVAA